MNLRDAASQTQAISSVHPFSPSQGTWILNLQVHFKFVSYAKFMFSLLTTSVPLRVIVSQLFWTHLESTLSSLVLIMDEQFFHPLCFFKDSRIISFCLRNINLAL